MRVTTLPPDPLRSGSREALLAEGLAAVRGRLAAAAALRRPGAPRVALLPVTKSLGVDDTLAFARLLTAESGRAAGPVPLGENRASDLEAKAEAAARAGLDIAWHFVGHVQRNKLRRIARHAAVVHSVDSLALVDGLARAAADTGKRLGVYVQVDLTPDPAKTGLDEAGARAVARAAAASLHLALLGLMAMGPLEDPPGAATAAVFARVAALAADLAADPEVHPAGSTALGLSLGMSADLELAVAAGSTLVRVGSDLFAPFRAAEARGAATAPPPETNP